MPDAFLLLLGGFVGFVVFQVSLSFRPTISERLDKESFKVAFPKKMAIYYLYKVSFVVWIVLYLTVVFPMVATRSDVSSTYFIGYFAFGGVGIFDHLLIIITRVYPIRGEPDPFRFKYLLVNDLVRRIGLLRLGLFVGTGLLSWVIINLLV